MSVFIQRVPQRVPAAIFAFTFMNKQFAIGQSVSVFIQRVPAAIFAFTFMKKQFTSAATANRTLMALIYIPLKGFNLPPDYKVCVFLNTFLVLNHLKTL